MNDENGWWFCLVFLRVKYFVAFDDAVDMNYYKQTLLKALLLLHKNVSL